MDSNALMALIGQSITWAQLNPAALMGQVALAVFSTLAIWLSQDERADSRRWGAVFGLLSQPFWFYTAYQAEAWGVFFMSLIYSVAWLRGIRNGWFRSRRAPLLAVSCANIGAKHPI